MTIAVTRTRELDINTIVQRSMQLAGLMSPQQSTSDPAFAPQRTMAVDFLELICKGVQGGAVIERHVVRQTAAVTALSATVTLATSAMTMVGTAMFTETGFTEETPVNFIDLQTYQAIPEKTLTGRPAQGYFARQPIPTVTLWPVPDVNGTLTVVSHILSADVSNASETIDFERNWTDYFVWELAHYLSVSAGMPKQDCGYMRSRAEEKLEICKRYSKSNVAVQMRYSHRTPWSR